MLDDILVSQDLTSVKHLSVDADNAATLRDFYVTSARKFELNNDLSCPDIKEK